MGRGAFYWVQCRKESPAGRPLLGFPLWRLHKRPNGLCCGRQNYANCVGKKSCFYSQVCRWPSRIVGTARRTPVNLWQGVFVLGKHELKLNVKKSYCMAFHGQRKWNTTLTIQLCGKKLEQVADFKYRGEMISKKLSIPNAATHQAQTATKACYA